MRVSPLTKYLVYQLYHAHLLVRKIGAGEAESLHQFRVALRRVRSLLKLYTADTIIFPKILKTCIRNTNSLRELDVFLLSVNPVEHKHAYNKLQIIRDDAYTDIFTEEFKQALNNALEEFYDLLIESNPGFGRDELVRKTIEHYEESMSLYLSLPDNPSNKELHAVRIRFKISRYGLEFLHESSIESEKEKISECKQFQNRFGEIQDLYNQVHWLKKFCEEHPLAAFEKLRKERKKKLKKLKESSL